MTGWIFGEILNVIRKVQIRMNNCLTIAAGDSLFEGEKKVTQLTCEQYQRLVGLAEESLDAAYSRYLDSFASLNSYQDSYASDCDIFSEDILELLKDGVYETYAEYIALLGIYNFLTHSDFKGNILGDSVTLGN